MANNHADMWQENFQCLKDYIAEYNEMPSRNTIYKNHTIGIWLDTQRAYYRKNSFPMNIMKL